MGFPIDCNLCAKAKTNRHLFHGDIELSLRPVVGSNPSVMLVGQDPTVARGKIHTVLDLENTRGSLYKYIVGAILEPVRLKLDDVYATDLVKCRFPDNQTPSAVAKKHDMTIMSFLSPFFRNCREWFLQEVTGIRPKIIVSFGEPVHKLLIKEFGWAVPTSMKEAFSNTYKVGVLGDSAYYAPCIHINSRGHSHYKALWSKFIESLGGAVISADVV